MSKWRVENGRLKSGPCTLADLRYATTDKGTENLIAAAPELLEACIRLLPHAVAARYEEHPDIVFAADVIAKAEEVA